MLIKWVVKLSVCPVCGTGQLPRYPAEPGISRLRVRASHGARWKGHYQILQSIEDLEYKEEYSNGGVQL